jgi:subtilisin family serine protease
MSMKLGKYTLSHAAAAKIIALAALAGCNGAPDGAATDETAAVTAAPAAPAPVWITLLTGDRVLATTTEETPVSSVVPGPGRDGMSFSMTVRRGHVYVTPRDAAALVAAGTLDAELFDVTALARFGYDDAQRSSVPLIVTYRANAALAPAAAPMAIAGAQVTHALTGVDGVAMEVRKDAAADAWRALTRPAAPGAALASREIKKVWLDGLLQPTLDRSVPQIGAPAAWAAGFTGKDVVVAVLDSGLDAAHADFAGKVVDARNFTSEADTSDRLGHGTHVASTIAGTGAASNGRFRGVAPDARLLIGKVCTPAGCPTSAILAGIEWAAIDKAARIVNLSLGGPDTPDIDPLEEAINRISAERGTLFVIAAGNEGDRQTIDSPGSAEAALTVGAVDRDDALAEFSSRGPRRGDGGIKPDLTAPGVDIVAALAAGTHLGEVVDGVYVRLSGTSMATPHVAGAAALLLQQHPDWRGDRLKAALMGSARRNPELTPFEQGTGRVDVAAAITRQVVATPASLNLGVAPWPHDDDAPVVRTVTYRNAGSAPVALQLAVAAQRPDGQAAPAAMFKLSASAITVPAGGAVDVALTADTRVKTSDGAYTGQLVATAAGGVASAIPLAILREAESYDLSLAHVDRDGAPASDFQTTIARLDGSEEAELLDVFSPDGKVVVRLPRGRYLVYSAITTTHGDAAHRAILVQASLALTAASTVTFDSRTARPIRVSVPRPQAQLQFSAAGFRVVTPTLFTFSSFTFAPDEEAAIGQVGPPGPPDELLAHVNAQLAERGPAGDFVNSPRFYALSWNQPGRFFTGFDKRVRNSELTVVHADYRAAGADQKGAKVAFPINIGGFADTQSFTLPFQRTEYYSANAGGWGQSFEVTGKQGLAAIGHYRPGHDEHEIWSGAVIGPAFRTPPSAIRTGDRLTGVLALLSDAAGHLGDANASGVTRLFRGSEKIGELRAPGRLLFNVDPAAATYRLETEATRTSPDVVLSTRVTAAWTFRSQHVEQSTALPLLAVRFAPALDDRNRARAGAPLIVPVSVARMPEAPSSPITQLTLEASFDDGATWQRTLVLRRGSDAIALVLHPWNASFVSLRATAADADGNRVEQTVIHAYALRR